ncbi:high-affinity nicotinic acid transporter [Xylogone sp. PMI_703]|nr:high-affinity nicotinic acid transporter [Xylogone sp. PMI_703]
MADIQFGASYDEKNLHHPTTAESATPSDLSEEHRELLLKKAHRKVDKRLLIWYAFVYLIMRVHVSNITNTAIVNLEDGDGIKKQLGNLTSQQWAWALSIFYYPYMSFEPIATLLLKKFTPRLWMCRIMLTWGIISMCQGATQNYAGLLACRFFLGLAECGFYPGVIYHLSFWYNTKRMPLRIAFFFASGMFSGTISGLLAYAIGFMNGAGGLAGWRWIFILEGLPAILCSIVTFFLLPNYPETAKFLTEEERDAVLSDLPAQAPSMKAKTLNCDQVKELFLEPTLVPFLLLWILHGIGGQGVTYILPTAIYDLGIQDTARSQLMTMPPYAMVFVVLVTLGYLIHKGYLNPWITGLCLEVMQIICYILILTVKNKVAKYIFIVFATAGGQSLYPIIWPERIRAARGTTTAGLAIGMTNGFAQLMGIVGPQIYQSKFGPSYRVSYICSISLLSGSVCMISLAWLLVTLGDRKRKAQEGLETGSSDSGDEVKN